MHVRSVFIGCCFLVGCGLLPLTGLGPNRVETPRVLIVKTTPETSSVGPEHQAILETTGILPVTLNPRQRPESVSVRAASTIHQPSRANPLPQSAGSPVTPRTASATVPISRLASSAGASSSVRRAPRQSLPPVRFSKPAPSPHRYTTVRPLRERVAPLNLPPRTTPARPTANLAPSPNPPAPEAALDVGFAGGFFARRWRPYGCGHSRHPEFPDSRRHSSADGIACGAHPAFE